MHDVVERLVAAGWDIVGMMDNYRGGGLRLMRSKWARGRTYWARDVVVGPYGEVVLA